MTLASARRLFDRAAEMESLEQAWRAAAAAPVVVGVEGPSGVGKSLLVRTFLKAMAPDPPILWTAADEVAPHPQAVGQHLAQALGLDGAGWDPIDALREAPSPLIWVIDHYDAWREFDAYLCETVWPRLRPGTLVMAIGREPFAALWHETPDVRGQRRILSVLPWAPEVTRRYLASAGMPTWLAALGELVSGGSPTLASRLAATFNQHPTVVESLDAGQALSLFMERALHPGSRRLNWRAGLGDESLDAVVAPALLFPTFTRPLLGAVVGSDLTARHWERLCTLPLVESRGPGLWGFRGALRAELEPAVLQLRPWAARHWRWHAARFVAWAEGAGTAVIAEEVLRTVLAPRVLAGQAWPTSWQVHWPAATARKAVVLTDASGQVLASAEGQFPRASEPGPAVVERIALSPGCPHAWEALATVLLASAVLARGLVVEAQVLHDSGVDARLLTRWFQAYGFETHDPQRWELALGPRRLGPWLSRLLYPDVPAPRDRLFKAAREALLAIHDLDQLEHSDLAQLWPERLSPVRLRHWLLDALSSADLGEWPSGRALLTLYYVERKGPHELLAERLNVSRATYFRTHQRALTRLAEHLFLPPAPER